MDYAYLALLSDGFESEDDDIEGLLEAMLDVALDYALDEGYYGLDDFFAQWKTDKVSAISAFVSEYFGGWKNIGFNL